MLPRTTQIARMLRLPHWLYAPQSGDDRNMNRGMLDGFGVGMVEVVRIFIPVLLTRLGADPISVGLLSSMPAIAGLLLAVPLGLIISRSNNVIPWYAWSRLLLFLSYPIMAVIPLFFDAQTAILVMIGVAAIATLPQTALSLVFNVVMGAIIDTSRRYQLMSLRWSVLGVCNGISVYIAGQYLGSNAPLTAYAIVICGASLFTVFAFLPARQYEVPPERRDTHAPPQSIRKAFTQIVFFVRNYRTFRLFIICQAVFQCGLTMSVPLFPLHWIRVLNADDNIIGTVSMIQSVTLLFGYMAGTYIATRFKGRVVILWVCSIALGTYPLITALVGSMAPLLFFAAIWGVATAGIELVLLDMLLDSCPPGQVTAVMPAYQIAMFTVSLLGPLIGTIVAQNSNTTIALMLAAGLHFCGAALFIFFKIGRAHKQISPVTP